MAERSYRSDSAEFSNDDPFAELTRIMGHDPRQARQPEPEFSHSDQSYDASLDMESELMSGYDRHPERLETARDLEPEYAREIETDFDAVFANEFAAVEEIEDVAPARQDYQPEWTAPVEHHAPAAPVQGYAPQPPDAPASLEDELTALLADDQAVPQLHAAPADPVYEEQQESAADAFDYARAAATRPAFEDELEAPLAYAANPEPDVEADELDLGDEFDAALAREMSEAMEADDAPADDAGQWQAEPAAAMAAASRHSDPVAQPRPAAPVEEPDLEFTEIAEAAPVVSDDLDIPELAEPEEVPVRSEMDDFEAEFGHALTMAAMPHAAQLDENTAESDEDMDELFRELTGSPGRQDAAVAGAAALAGGAAAASYGRGYGDTAQDPDDDAEAYDAPAPRRQSILSRRNTLIGASVAALALVIGAGALAVGYFGGGSDDTPALVRAEVDPIKVRPENPGGAQVANQGNPVYDRVSGQTPAAAQETLVTTTEDPVELPGQTAEIEPEPMENAVVEAPGTGQDVEVAAIPTGKSEDRVEVAEDQLTSAESDMIAVAPKRVRTMVVRPDGTMVPREAPAPQPSDQLVAAASPVTAPGSSALAPAAPESVEPDPVTPSVAPRATARPEQAAARPAAPAPAPTQPRAPEQVAAVNPAPAAAQPTAAAPASSEWSMQIASQPTPEGAQSTYRDLLQRYGGVLAGRGVQIVKADIAGKGTYYRVRIPSASRDEAISLCGRYKSAGGTCFVSK